jgi:excisionase family DNA binding protein
MTATGAPDDALSALMTVDDLAQYLAVSPATIYGWNYTRSGPTPIRVGRHVRYRRSVVEAWLDEKTRR